MKTKILAILCIIFTMVGFISCSKDDDKVIKEKVTPTLATLKSVDIKFTVDVNGSFTDLVDFNIISNIASDIGKCSITNQEGSYIISVTDIVYPNSFNFDFNINKKSDVEITESVYDYSKKIKIEVIHNMSDGSSDYGSYVAKRAEKYNIDLSNDKSAMFRLKLAAEEAKKTLSNVTTANVNIPFITMTNGMPVHFDVTVSRATFESLIKDLVDSTCVAVRDALKQAKITARDLDQVLLVGGSTRVPCVQELVRREKAEKIREFNKDCYIIFTTGHLEYSLVAYKLKTFDYLAKPIDKMLLQV